MRTMVRAIGFAVVSAVTLCAVPFSSALAQSKPAERQIILERMIFDGKPSFYTNIGARVSKLKRGGDGFLAVRTGPGAQFPERDRLVQDRYVYALPAVSGWRPVIFGETGEELDVLEKRCGLNNPPPDDAPIKRVYTGPCRYGWVDQRWLTLLAD